MSKHELTYSVTNPTNLWRATFSALKKLTPRNQLRNPVMFVVFIGSILTTLLFFRELITPTGHETPRFILSISVWLWFTVLFANFAESIAEGRGKAQADNLKAARREIQAKKLRSTSDRRFIDVASTDLRINDLVLVEASDFIPGDGQIIEGVASIDESAITGESAPVIRESGSDHDSVTGGTRLLSDWLVIRITANPGEMFIDKMISLVEGARRQKTPNEIALSILLAAMTIVFLVVTTSLWPFSFYSVTKSGQGAVISITVLVSLLVCLAPTTIGGLLSAIGIAGMNRLMKTNVIAMSGRAVEAAGDVNILLLDKTGTITYGNRHAVAFINAEGVAPTDLAKAAELSSLADDTPEGKSIVVLAHEKYNITLTDRSKLDDATFIPFTAETRISGVRLGEREILKGAGDAIAKYIVARGGTMPDSLKAPIEQIARQGGTPLIVADGTKVLGVVHLKDVIKPGIKERLAALRNMGIKSVMITGDNPLTAAAIASEAGVDDFMAEAKPEDKLNLIREKQRRGEMVAMVGDGTNDAPALAQSDVAVCMNSGTQAAKEAANMIDLDSDPTKLIEVVEIGKQLLMTRGALTTFSIANDVAKYFAIIPAAFASTFPKLAVLNIMGLTSPMSAILSAVIFNALIIVFLIPLALKGVKYRAASADHLLRHHSLVYGVGGVIVPFVGIKAIDWLLTAVGIV